jgi:hypothetical protein
MKGIKEQERERIKSNLEKLGKFKTIIDSKEIAGTQMQRINYDYKVDTRDLDPLINDFKGLILSKNPNSHIHLLIEGKLIDPIRNEEKDILQEFDGRLARYYRRIIDDINTWRDFV